MTQNITAIFSSNEDINKFKIVILNFFSIIGIMNTLGNISDGAGAKGPAKYECEKCNFKCSKKYSWERHLATQKHKLDFNSFINNKEYNYICTKCNEKFQTNSGLWKHKNKCNPKTNVQNLIEEKLAICDKLVNVLIKDNSDLKNLILEQQATLIKFLENNERK